MKFSKPVLYLLFAFIAITASFALNEQVFEIIKAIRSPSLTGFFQFITNGGIIFFLMLFIGFLALQTRFKEIIFALSSGAVSFFIGTLLKKIFQVPRPYDLIEPLMETLSKYSFPSNHSAFVFAFLPFVWARSISKFWKYMFTTFIVLIAVSRMYLGVHTFADVVAGSIIGFSIGKLVQESEKKSGFIKTFLANIFKTFELRRQMAHLFIGAAIIILFYFDFLSTKILLVILFVGLILSLLSKKFEIPIIAQFLNFFERPLARQKFPGKGAFFLVLGSFSALILYEKNIALAAIAIMAVGDSLATIFGTQIGKIANPLNGKKTLEGTLIAFFLATLGAAFFVSFPVALVGGLSGLLIESAPLKIGKVQLDDNLLVPIIAGIVMSLM